ncbi:hypothetical protein PR048_025341 [Dryococelus australis]|uniref:Uncharacterized protein n=1 Tax=Dryococelus australis TaxID=614101 RepID=A0ABQ9GR33_9NEOP|nr:hypothetical protein PR048_025341 [Dryococelus australis]
MNSSGKPRTAWDELIHNGEDRFLMEQGKTHGTGTQHRTDRRQVQKRRKKRISNSQERSSLVNKTMPRATSSTRSSTPHNLNRDVRKLVSRSVPQLRFIYIINRIRWLNTAEVLLPEFAPPPRANYGRVRIGRFCRQNDHGITAKAGSGLLELCFFRKSHVDKDPAPKENCDIDVRDIICWKTFPVHERKADNTAVNCVFGNASMFSRKKMKMELGIVPDEATGQRVFSGISRFPRPCNPALLLTHLASSTSALKNSMLRSGDTATHIKYHITSKRKALTLASSIPVTLRVTYGTFRAIAFLKKTFFAFSECSEMVFVTCVCHFESTEQPSPEVFVEQHIEHTFNRIIGKRVDFKSAHFIMNSLYHRLPRHAVATPRRLHHANTQTQDRKKKYSSSKEGTDGGIGDLAQLLRVLKFCARNGSHAHFLRQMYQDSLLPPTEDLSKVMKLDGKYYSATVTSREVSWWLLTTEQSRRTQQEPVTTALHRETEYIPITHKGTARDPLHTSCGVTCRTTFYWWKCKLTSNKVQHTANASLPSNCSPYATGSEYLAMLNGVEDYCLDLPAYVLKGALSDMSPVRRRRVDLDIVFESFGHILRRKGVATDMSLARRDDDVCECKGLSPLQARSAPLRDVSERPGDVARHQRCHVSEQRVKPVHDKVSTSEINVRKKSLALPARILTGALGDMRPVKLVTMEGTGEIWAALKIKVLGAVEGKARENPPASGIVRHTYHMRTRFAQVGGEQSNRCTTAAPSRYKCSHLEPQLGATESAAKLEKPLVNLEPVKQRAYTNTNGWLGGGGHVRVVTPALHEVDSRRGALASLHSCPADGIFAALSATHVDYGAKGCDAFEKRNSFSHLNAFHDKVDFNSAHFIMNSLYLHNFNGHTKWRAASKVGNDGEKVVPYPNQYGSRSTLRRSCQLQVPRHSSAVRKNVDQWRVVKCCKVSWCLLSAVHTRHTQVNQSVAREKLNVLRPLTRERERESERECGEEPITHVLWRQNKREDISKYDRNPLSVAVHGDIVPHRERNCYCLLYRHHRKLLLTRLWLDRRVSAAGSFMPSCCVFQSPLATWGSELEYLRVVRGAWQLAASREGRAGNRTARGTEKSDCLSRSVALWFAATFHPLRQRFFIIEAKPLSAGEVQTEALVFPCGSHLNGSGLGAANPPRPDPP